VFEYMPYALNSALEKVADYYNNEMNELNRRDSLEIENSISVEHKRGRLNNLKIAMDNFLIEAFNKGILDISIPSIKGETIIIKRTSDQQHIMPKRALHDTASFLRAAEEMVKLKIEVETVRKSVMDVLYSANIPNVRFSKEQNELYQSLVASSVPKTIGFIRKDEIIVDKGDRLSAEQSLKLRSYYTANSLKSDTGNPIYSYIGSLGHTAIIFLILLIYLFKLRPKIFEDNFQLSILLLFLILTALQSWISVEIETDIAIEMLILLPCFSMLTVIVFDSRTSFYITTTMALLLAGIRGNDYVTAIEMLFAGMLAGYTVRDLQSRTALFQSVFFIFLGFLAPIIFFGLERATEIGTMIQKTAIAGANSLVSPLLAFGVLYVLERFTWLTTDLRLQEYNNLNHPLLTKLSEIAPGTYQHSMGVALLSERCANAIGANALYCKVASYYHDIGKMHRPEYFAENQIGISNKHDAISAKKSAEIIIEHVTEGVVLAKKYKLPQRIIDVILMHHGTSVVQHFYAKALENAKVQQKEVNEDDFRYPGPSPASKEAAIIMICDSAEALSRLPDRTPEELEEMLTIFISERISEGQFDGCDLTLKEITVIKKIVLKNIVGLSHKRTEYKKINKNQ